MAHERIGFAHGAGVGSEIAKHLADVAVEDVATRIAALAQEFKQAANDLVMAELITDRQGPRSKGGRKLLGSFEVKITRSPHGPYPIEVAMSSRADSRKVGALEYGSPGHSILPDGKFLYFPYNPGGPPAGNAYESSGFLAKIDKVGVSHPGNRAHHFMRRALEDVMDRHFQ